MNEVTEEQAARIIRALTIQFPKVAQKLGVSRAAGHVLRHLRSNGEKCLLDVSDDLNMSELHAHRVLSALERNKYLVITDDNKYKVAEIV